MEAFGYLPFSQTWIPGAYTTGQFIGAAFLCLVIIGILIFIYMLIIKPEGSLAVTYHLCEPVDAHEATEKNCPKCAENVKAAAQICRFCGFSFVQ